MADFEDSLDKARRNLLMLSAAILASAYLQPKFADRGKIFGFIDAENVDPWRMWLVITLVLVYFVLRYWLSENRDFARLDLVEGHRSGLRRVVQSRVAADAVAFLNNGEDSGVVPAFRKGQYTGPKQTPIRDVRAEVPQDWPVKWDGEAEVRWNHPPDELGQPNGGLRVVYEFGRPARCRYTVKAWIRTLVFSRGAYELLLPLILAAIAFVFCVCSLVRHWHA